MPEIVWDLVGERTYETGVDHGVLYLPDNTGVYDTGFAWNGLTSVTVSPSGAEASAQYADNMKYLNLTSAEEFGATVEAFTYPPEFAECDGSARVRPGVTLGQQGRRMFGLSWRTLLGNDVLGNDYGYKLHLVWGAQAAPSERAYATVNDSPEAQTLSWELTTTAVPVGLIDGVNYKPTAYVTVSSVEVDPTDLLALEDLLYGRGAGGVATLPSPADVVALFPAAVIP